MYIRVRESKRRDDRGRIIKRYTAVWVENGAEFGETFDTREAAQDRLNRVKTLLMQGKSAANLREAGKVTFGAVADDWLAGRPDLKRRTRDQYTNLLATKSRARRRADGESTGDLSISATFGAQAVNSITRADIAKWVTDLAESGKAVSTIRHHFFVVKAVLGHAVADGRILDNPAVHVKLPTERTVTNSSPGVVDDPDMFLTAAQVSALVDATPWPCAVMVHLAAWSGMRAAELAGLQVGDIDWPVNPNGTVWLRVRRTVIDTDAGLAYDTTKTKGSDRRVPVMPNTAQLLRDYVTGHPRRNEPTAPLFCSVTLAAVKRNGKRATDDTGNQTTPTAASTESGSGSTTEAGGDSTAERKPLTAAQKADRQARALADLSVDAAAARLVLDWSSMLRHQTFYKAVYRPAVLRANRMAGSEVLPESISFHALRHTYASLCAAAGIDVAEVSRNLGHSKVTTTLDIYTHLFRTDDTASAAMAKLAALAAPPIGPNVVPIRQRR